MKLVHQQGLAITDAPVAAASGGLFGVLHLDAAVDNDVKNSFHLSSLRTRLTIGASV